MGTNEVSAELKVLNTFEGLANGDSLDKIGKSFNRPSSPPAAEPQKSWWNWFSSSSKDKDTASSVASPPVQDDLHVQASQPAAEQPGFFKKWWNKGRDAIYGPSAEEEEAADRARDIARHKREYKKLLLEEANAAALGTNNDVATLAATLAPTGLSTVVTNPVHVKTNNLVSPTPAPAVPSSRAANQEL